MWYSIDGLPLAVTYDIDGKVISEEEPFIERHLPYEMTTIDNAWLSNAKTVRDQILALYNQTHGAIPFFIQTDGHGRKNDGNIGCQNLAEPTMGYIANIQLGDWESRYYDGTAAKDHKFCSHGIVNYIPVAGNHEFLANNSTDAVIADLPTIADSFSPYNRILGSSTYGFYTVIDPRKRVKFIVLQPHIPVQKSIDSSGFQFKIVSEQWEWLIREMQKNDGYDIVVLCHEPFPGKYIRTFNSTEVTWKPSFARDIDITQVLASRKSKGKGTAVDSDGIEHSFDFSGCTSDFLCTFHGHTHSEWYCDKTQFGFPVYVGTLFDNTDGFCAYGLIDRQHRKLYVRCFGKRSVKDMVELDL